MFCFFLMFFLLKFSFLAVDAKILVRRAFSFVENIIDIF